jgi:hypothetical protein
MVPLDHRGGSRSSSSWALATLGRFFTNDVRVQAGQTVVESGPYRWVRLLQRRGNSPT